MKLLPAALLLLCCAAPGRAAQELYWPEAGAFAQRDIPAAARPAGAPAGCPRPGTYAAAPDSPPAVKEVSEVDAGELPLPADDLQRAGILEVLKTDLDYWNQRPDTAKVQLGKDTFDAPRLRRTVTALIDIFNSPMEGAELLQAIKTRFRVYRASADDGTGKTVITGYYEAEIKISMERDQKHTYPVYLTPSDLVKTTPDMGVSFDYGRYDAAGKLVKYYSTQEIHAGALAGRGLELAWAQHPSHIMLLQIQGSGILRLPGGDYLRAGFDGANGWPYGSVQKALMDCGEIPSMSFKDFIAYLSSQPPDREERLTDINPRYIFFQGRPRDSLPYGAIGRPLTPGRSIAIDPKYVPLGLFGLLRSKRPVAQNGGLGFREFTRFIATHDTGSAIRGPGRVDLFWGAGETAETEASSMKAPGELYLFILK
ncbi:MAG: MltA domain-containing protein [Elusimicrobiota bacterium]